MKHFRKDTDTWEFSTMFLCPLLHVGSLLFREAQKAQHAILERRDFKLDAELLIACMEITKAK